MNAILKKLHDVRCAVQYMQKEGRNSAMGYSFLAESQITAQFKQLFDAHGIVFIYDSRITGVQPTPSGKQLLTNVEVTYSFVDAETGEKVFGVASGQGCDSGDKGVYKAITGAIKYIFMKSFLIPTGDDPEDDSGTPRGKRAAAFRASEYYGTTIGDDKPPFGAGSEDED